MKQPLLFNSLPVSVSTADGVEPDQATIETVPNLRGASIADAVRFGGPAVSRILERMPIHCDRRYVIVDTKVAYLMQGWSPSIPGWHTDGVPRGAEGDARDKGAPNLRAMIDDSMTAPRFHLYVSGTHCPTEFLEGMFMQQVDMDAEDDRSLYSSMDTTVNTLLDIEYAAWSTFRTQPDRIYTWDWWSVHRAIPAEDTGWRLLIRVTETDYIPPRTEGFIRRQNQVYIPQGFGW